MDTVTVCLCPKPAPRDLFLGDFTFWKCPWAHNNEDIMPITCIGLKSNQISDYQLTAAFVSCNAGNDADAKILATMVTRCQSSTQVTHQNGLSRYWQPLLLQIMQVYNVVMPAMRLLCWCCVLTVKAIIPIHGSHIKFWCGYWLTAASASGWSQMMLALALMPQH